MILSRNNVLVTMLMLLAFSCMKEEIPVPKHEPGENQANEVGMEQDYRNQLYFDLGTNQVVKSNLKTEWDLAFESAGNHVVLNTGKGMAIHRSSLAFEAITSADDLEWTWDAHSGNLDSTAIGNWMDNDYVYVVDRGYDWEGEHQGYFKLKIMSRTAEAYKVEYGDLESTSPTNYTLSTESTQFTYFSLENQKVDIAPEDSEYDLIFTQYTHLFTDPLTPYLVTGVLLNRNFTSVARLDEKNFEAITLEDAATLSYNHNLNAIGYDWKYYSLEDGIFTTDPDKHYIIRTQDGVYYKLRFLGFYNTEGLKGYPGFEFQSL